MRRALRAGLPLSGLAVGVLSFLYVRDSPAYAYVGDSAARAVAELATGYALLAVGVVSRTRRPESRFGIVLAVAGVGWLLAEWNNPGVDSALAFTVGLVVYAAAPALVAHASLSYPGGGVCSQLERLALTIAYLGAVVVLGLLPALPFDPQAQGCSECSRNLLLVDDSRGLVEDLSGVGLHLGVVWSIVLAALLALRLRRSTPALRRLRWPVLLAGAAYLGLVAWQFARSLDRGFLGNDTTDVDLRLAQAVALGALSLGVAWSWLRDRRTRGRVARLVVELAESHGPGGLRDLLRETLGDPSLALAYPIADGRMVDARGCAVDLRGQVTPLVRDGRAVAFLSHRAGLLDDPGLVEELVAAARLALEHERLQAEARTQLEDLRASRARVIAAGDSERRRLERDLHDGAQQRLVVLALALRLSRMELGPDPDPSLVTRLGDAEAELRGALAELRELAHGIFPAVLADEGLAAALETLAEETPIPIRLTQLPAERFDPAVEAVGYAVVAEALRRGASALKVAAVCGEEGLSIDVEVDHVPRELTDIEDRVDALDGTLEVLRGPGERATIRAVIPDPGRPTGARVERGARISP